MIIVHTGISVVLTRKYRDTNIGIFLRWTQSEVIAAMEADAVKENMNRDDHEKEQEKGTGSWE